MKGRRLFYWIVLLFFVSNAVIGQDSKLGACAVRRSNALDSIVKLKKDTDSLAIQQLSKIDRDWQNCVVGSPVPAFALNAMNGKKLDNNSLTGKITVINFWFTSCAPCVAEIPGLNRLVDEYRNSDVAFVGFTFEDERKIASEFLPVHPFRFTIVPEAGSMEKVFGVNDYPSTFIVDASGKIRQAWSGGPSGPTAKEIVYKNLKTVIDHLLAETKTDKKQL